MKSIKEILRDNLIWICLLGFILLFLEDLVASFTDPFPLPNYFDSNFQYTFNMYVGFWGTWATFLIFVLVFRKKNKYILDSIKHNKQGNTVKMLMLGFGTGFALNGFCVLVAMLHGDFKLHFYKFEVLQLVLLLIVVFIQSSSEELICRGFIYQRIKDRYNNIPVAIAANLLLFAALHLGNNGISAFGFIDLLFSGVFFSMLVFVFDSIWAAMACHTAWNYTQNILFGLPNSGELSKYSIFMMDKNSVISSFAFDKAFGLEGTVLSMTLMLGGSVALYFYAQKHGKQICRAKSEQSPQSGR